MNLKEEIGFHIRPLWPFTLNQAQEQTLEYEVWVKERNQEKVNNLQN